LETVELYQPTFIVPNICEHSLGRLKKNCVTVKLTQEEYVYCDTASQNFWANSKKGAYGKGILNSQDDPTKTERVGLLGEMAFAKIAGLGVNFAYSEGGEPFDFQCSIGTIDIKTAAKLSSYKELLLYAKSGSGKEIPLTSQYYVAAFLAHEDREAQKATVVIVGYCTKEYLEAQPLVQAKVGFHHNKTCSYKDLQDIEILLNLINPEDSVLLTHKEEEENDDKSKKKKL